MKDITLENCEFTEDIHDYTSVGCNRTCNCLAISKNTGLVYYGGNAAVVVYSQKNEKILNTLVQHEKRINCITLLEHDLETTYVFSGCSNGDISIWEVKTSDLAHTSIGRSTCHQGSITCLHAVYYNKDIILVSTGNDSRIKIWKINTESDKVFEHVYDLDLKNSLSFCVHMVNWPSPYLTLFYSLDNCSICVAQIDISGELHALSVLKGHEDWVTSLDSFHISWSSILLASTGHDSIVRIWRLENTECSSNSPSLHASNLEVKDVLLRYAEDNIYRVQLESVLCGHEDKVNSVQWHKGKDNKISLLTASLDKTMIVWAEDQDGLWMEKARFGEIGGNTLGMFGAAWGPDDDILGYSFSGALHSWLPVQDGTWKSGTVVGGHQGSVTDLSWDVDGRYLLSVSIDQTTRCHAVCQATGRWHQVARPQVHGYDITCVTTLPNMTFVAGAEEKVLRAFKAPQNFLDNFERLTGLNISNIDRGSLPQGASLPTLGLSNKAVYQEDMNKQIPEENRHVKDQFPDFYFSPETLEKPPTEECLVQNTLWPEVHKMYGHGYEVFCVGSSADGQLVASACKSAQPKEAAILIWDTKTWKEIGRIEAHSLTVTQLQFSPTDNLLISVSRDRTWALHKLQWDGVDLSISKVRYSDKKTSPHKRIIWTCCWSHDGKYFYTGSRDKILACWNSDGDLVLETPLVLPESVTALAGCSIELNGRSCYIVGVGLENGHIHLLQHDDQARFSPVIQVQKEQGHHATVSRLQFNKEGSLLASAGQDHIVRIYSLNRLFACT